MISDDPIDTAVRSRLDTDVVRNRYGCSVMALCVLETWKSHAGNMVQEAS